jgi:nucleoside-triphosphatase THEP1
VKISANRANADTLIDEVKVDLDVFGALMVHQVSREVNCTHIVTVDKSGMLQRLSQFLKELS